jgi:preprotein translocase SecE subunit
MSNFISEASAELEHVVWPTPVENKKYMMYTIGVIVVLGVFLAVLGYLVTNWLTLTRAQFPHEAIVSTVSGEDTMSQEELDKLIKNITVNTGAVTTATGTRTTTQSGATTASGSR